MTGWIKIHRQIKDHWIYKDSDKLRAWITILLEVNHSKQKVNLGNKIYKCGVGESLNSLNTWTKLFGLNWNKSKTRRFLKLLQNENMIGLKSVQKTTHLTVCNYDSYQVGRNGDETEMKRKRNGDETQVTPNKNEENEEKVKNEIKRKERKEKFKISLSPFLEKYGKNILNEFYSYWTEHGENDKKMRFEKQVSFSIGRRLSTWSKREKEFKGNKVEKTLQAIK